MAQPLIDRLGIERDVVALVGAGGKTTIAFTVAAQARQRGLRVIVTTTTKLGADQNAGFTVVPPDADRVGAALDESGACLVVAAVDGHKALGVAPAWVDEMARAGIADVIVVEADGARRRRIKAPGPHEPVMPGAASLVVAVMAASAVGGVIAEVAHRPDRVAATLGVGEADLMTAQRAAALMASPRGGRKSVPAAARFVVAITGAAGPALEGARRVAGLLDPVPSVLLDAAAVRL